MPTVSDFDSGSGAEVIFSVVGRVQNNSGIVTAAAGLTATLPNPVTVGSLVVVTVAVASNVTPSFFAGAHNGGNVAITGLRLQVVYIVATTTTNSFAVTWTGNNNAAWTCQEWYASAGWPPTPALDGNTIGSHATASTAIGCGSPVSSVAGPELWIAALSWTDTGQTLSGVTAGWAAGDSATTTGITCQEYYQVAAVGSTGTFAATLSTAEVNGGVFVPLIPKTAVTSADSGSGTDTYGLTAQVPGSDSGSGTDTVTGFNASLSGADAGSGSEISALAVLANDSGSGSEISALAVLANDYGSGTDTVTGFNASLSGTDAGSGSDTVTSVSASLSSTDAGSGSDTVTSIRASLSGADAGSGSDTYGLTASLSGADSGSGTETSVLGLSSTDAGSGGGLPVTQFYSYYFTGGSLNGWLGFEGSLTNTASPPAGSPYPNAAVLSTTGAFAFMYAPAVNVVTGEVLTISAQVYPGQSPVYIGFSGYPNPGGGGSSTGTFAAADTVTVNAWSQVLSYTWTVTAGTRSVLPLIELLSAVNGTLLYAEAITVTASVTGLEVASATVRLSGTDAGSGSDTVTSVSASLSSTDAGSGTETSVLGLRGTDSGSGVGTYKLITVYFSSDSGHGQEGDTEGYASADTGTGAESWQPPAVMTADAASGLDAGTVFASGNDADAASGLDAGQLIVAALDSGNGAENLTQAIGIFPYPPPWLFGFGGSYLLIWRPGTPEERAVRRFDRLAPWVVRYAELIRASDSLLDITDTDSASGRDTDIDSAPGSPTSGWGAIGLRMRVTEISLNMQAAGVRLYQRTEGAAELVLLAEEG